MAIFNCMRSILFFILIIHLFACKSEDKLISERIAAEVSSLQSIEEKKAFLEAIFQDHVDNRLAETEIWNRDGRGPTGRGSEAYQEEINSNRAEDLILAEKLHVYLNTFGYPSIMKMGRKAAIIPIAHMTYIDDDQMLADNFTYFYDAYKFNDITSDIFYDYLYNLNNLSWKERRELLKDRTHEQVIDTLLSLAKTKIDKK